MKRRGPDSLEGVFVAMIICLISTLMYGPSGLSSMLFVASITRYNTNRSKASLPFTLCNVLQTLSGPFIGYLAKKFSVRTIVLAGSIFAPLGIGVCYFAEDITAIILFWGITYGIGFGLASLLLPAIINDYFFKYRSIALGVSYLGSPLGFLVFPPIFEVLLDKYGLSGAFLLLCGINMHCIPLSMLLRRPNFKAKDENCHLNCGTRKDSYLSTDWNVSNQKLQPEYKDCEKQGIQTIFRRCSIEFLWNKSDSREHSTKQYFLSLNKKCDEPCPKGNFLRSFKNHNRNHYENLEPLPKLIQNIEQNGQLNCSKIASHHNSQNYETSKILDFKTNQHYDECSTIYFGTFKKTPDFDVREFNLKNQPDFKDIECRAKENNVCLLSGKVSSIPILLNYKQISEFWVPAENNCDEKSVKIQGSTSTVNSQSKNPLLNMYLNPIFILVCIINAIVSLHFTAVTTVIIDFSRDLNIDVENEKYIMMCISIAGGFGMLGFGWVTDGGYLTRITFGFLSQLISCVATAAFTFAVGFETLMIALAIWCVSQSSFIPMIPAIIAEYLEEDIQAVAVSACFLFCGPLYLIIPPLIGYFRDEKGSYDSIFYLLTGLSFVNCFAVFIIPCIARWKSKR